MIKEEKKLSVADLSFISARTLSRIFDPSKESFHYITKVLSYRREGCTVVLDCCTDKNEKIAIWIDLCGPDIFRLRMDASGERECFKKRTYMVIKEEWEDLPFDIKEEENRILIKTEKLVISVDKEPWQLSIYDSSGEIICQESPSNLNGLELKLNEYGICGRHPLGFCVGQSGQISTFESICIYADERFYGFGEKFSPLDKRGRRIVCWAVDNWGPSVDMAYKNIPFFMSTRGYGIFVNSSHKIIYEMGSESSTSYAFEVEDSFMDYYFIYGPSFKDIIARYTELTGKPAIPPKWSFGLLMSRYGYRNRKELEDVCKKLREKDIPCDTVHLDPFWMRKDVIKGLRCDLMWDEEAFPNPQEMIQSLREKGFKLCLWISPWIPQDTDMYKEGKKGEFFAKRMDGTIYEAYLGDGGLGAVVTGAPVDFSNPAAVKWYKKNLKRLLEMGASTFLTDQSEFTPEDAEYYNGMTGREMHNLYPLLFNKAVFEAVEEYSGRGIIIARSAFAGNQRYPANMAGDQSTRFSNLALVIMGELNSTLSALPYWSDDIGGILGLPSDLDADYYITAPGFAGKPTPALYVRWAQFGLFSPLSRCHGTTPREPWEYGEEALKIFRKYAKLRYRLIPYICTYAYVTGQTGISIVRPMILEFQDDLNCYDKDLQYMFGGELLVAPILDETGRRKIYLPKGRWINYWNGEEYEGPINLDYEASLDILPLFVKGDSIIPMGPEMNYIGEKPFNPITLDIYVYKRAEFTLQDDEETITFKCSRRGRRIKLDISKSAKRYILKFNKADQPRKVTLDSRKLKHLKTEKELKRNDEGWWYNPSLKTALVKFSVKGRKATVILE